MCESKMTPLKNGALITDLSVLAHLVCPECGDDLWFEAPCCVVDDPTVLLEAECCERIFQLKASSATLSVLAADTEEEDNDIEVSDCFCKDEDEDEDDKDATPDPFNLIPGQLLDGQGNVVAGPSSDTHPVSSGATPDNSKCDVAGCTNTDCGLHSEHVSDEEDEDDVEECPDCGLPFEDCDCDEEHEDDDDENNRW